MRMALPSRHRRYGVQSHLVVGLLLFLSIFPTAVRSQTHTPGHLQSGADNQGSSFASFGQYDSASNSLYIVGSTYGKWWTHDGTTTDAASGNFNDPACFYGVITMPDLDNGGLMDWTHTELIGKANTLEMCHSLLVDPTTQHVYMVGNSETPDQSLLGSIFNSGELGASDEVQIGMIMDFAMTSALTTTNSSDIDDDDTANPHKLHLLGGRVEQAYRINYPVAIAGVAGPNEKLYVATMMTDDVSRDGSLDGDQVDPTKVFKYGTQNSILFLREYSKTDIASNSGLINPNAGEQITLEKTLLRGESKEYATNGPPVNVATMIQVDDRLIVGGSTEGVGSELYNGQGADLDNMDGFVAQFNLLTLDPIGDTSAQSTFRVASGRDDFVTGLCAGDQSSAGHVYVTGYSNGHIANQTLSGDPDTTRGYILKLRLVDMTPVWVQEFEASNDGGSVTTVRAISCAVAHDGNNVFVAGEIDNGAAVALDATAKPAGGTDIWVAQISSQTGSTTDGQVVYVRQMGSDKDDAVAARGGLQVDQDGNAIVIGNTFGEVYRSRSAAEDGEIANVFVATFQLDTGEFMLPIDHEDFVTLPPKNTAPPTVAPAPTPAPQKQEEDDGDDGGWIFMMILLVLGIVGVIAGIMYWNMYRLPKREIPTDRTKVLEYLHDFDVEDIDLKHSATGGWHCSYAGDLAQGVNRQTNEGVYGAGYRDNTNDPLNRGGGRKPANFQSRGSEARKKKSENLDNFSIDDGDVYTDSIKNFGTSRDARRKSEERGGYNGLINAYHDNHLGGNGNAPEPSRRDKAKERWKNREIL